MAILGIMQYDTTRINETLVLNLGCLWLTWSISANPPRFNLNPVSFPFAQKHQSSQSPENYMSIKFPPPWDLTDRVHLFDRHLRQLGKSYTMLQYKAFEKSRGALESKRKHNGLAKLVNLTKHWGWTVTSWKTSAEADPKIRLQESEESDKTSFFFLRTKAADRNKNWT